MGKTRRYHRTDDDKVMQIGSHDNEIPVELRLHSAGDSTLDLSIDEISALVNDAIKYQNSGNEEKARDKLVDVVDILESLLKVLPKTHKQRPKLEESRKNYTEAIKKLEREIERESTTAVAPLINEKGQAVDGDNSLEFYKSQVPIVSKEDMDEFPDLEDIAGLEEVKDRIETEIDFIIKNPDLADAFQGSRALLLYGPPGNGKTEVMRGVAKSKNVNFIYVRPSDIFSKYVGESNKYLRATFEKAYDNQPSIIFIDEIDSIASKRTGDESPVNRQVKTELLQLMQGFDRKKSDRVWVVGATNRPQDLGSAFAGRRFPPSRQIYVGLPEKEARKIIIKKVLTKNLPKKMKIGKDVDYDKIADMFEGYSGSDIAELTQEVRERPVRELAKIQKSNPNAKTPRAIVFNDFKEQRAANPPSTPVEEVEQMKRWGKRTKEVEING